MKHKNSVIVFALAFLLASCVNTQQSNNVSAVNNLSCLNNGVVTATEADEFLHQNLPWIGANMVLTEKCGASELLKNTMAKYAGENVLYRVVVAYPYYERYYEEYTVTSENANAEIIAASEELENLKKYYEDNYKNLTGTERWEISKEIKNASKKHTEAVNADRDRYFNNIVCSELDFAEKSGALNITEHKANSDIGDIENAYYMLCNFETINKIADRKSAWLALAPADKEDGNNGKISKNLEFYLSQLKDTNTVEVVVLSVCDRYNKYAYDQNVQVNINYNKELYKPFSSGVGFSVKKLNVVLKEYIGDILKRNGISEENIISDLFTANGITENYTGKLSEDKVERISAGFNAILTKDEILNLAEDEEIKVIYLANANS